MSQYFGFEMLFRLVQADLKEKHEVVVVLAHWFLIREGYQCLGVGTEVTTSVTLVICNISNSCSPCTL